MTHLMLVRGIPGSGKSTFAKSYTTRGYLHFEADMWMAKSGTYLFDPSELRAAHV